MNCKRNLGPWSPGQFVALLIILLLASATRMFHLGDQSLWYDEADRVFIASLPLQRLLHAAAEEEIINLPFYFLILKPFTYPFNEVTVRYPSVFFCLLAVAFVAQAGRKLLGRTGGLIVALLLALNPFHIWFSRDASFYAPVALSAAGALYFFTCLLQRSTFRLWVGLALLTGIGLWTHYFAFAVPLVEFFYLLVTFRRHYRLLRMWTVAQAIAFLPLLPWYTFIIYRGQFYFGTGAYGSPKPVELLYTLWNFSIGYTEKVTPIVLFSLGFFWSALVLGVWQVWKRRDLVLLFFCLPIGMAFLMSYRLPMYVDRYLIGVLPAYLVLVSRGILKLPRKLRTIWLVALTLASTLGTARIYYDPEYYSKEDWRGVAAHIQSYERPGDAVMPLLYQSLIPLIAQYYHGELPFEPLIIQSIVRSPSTFADSYRRLWYVAPHPHDSTHLMARCQPFDLYVNAGNEQVRQWLIDHQDHLVQRMDLTCISVLLYDLTTR